jgi:hypothetical protein
MSIFCKMEQNIFDSSKNTCFLQGYKKKLAIMKNEMLIYRLILSKRLVLTENE